MKKAAPKKTAADKRMDTVLRKLLATPPQPHVEAKSKKTKGRRTGKPRQHPV